jgi:hypothetical protein
LLALRAHPSFSGKCFMFRTFRWAVVLLLLTTAPAWCAKAKHTIKVIKADPPKELKESISKLLGDQSVQFLDPKGSVICQLWFRKEVPAEATAEQIKTGLTYRELKETTLLGAVKFSQTWKDYRKKTIKPGVYTLRLGFQPMDGFHMGVSTHQEFCLLVAAGMDTKPDTMELKTLQQLSIKSMGVTHPGVLMLFPNDKPKATPQFVGKGENHWVLNVKLDVVVGGKKTPGGLGLGMTLIGEAAE